MNQEQKKIKAWAVVARTPHYDCGILTDWDNGKQAQYWIYYSRKLARKRKQEGTIQKVVPIEIKILCLKKDINKRKNTRGK